MLQLIIQQLANTGGKVLTNELVIAVIKQLSKLQTPEGEIYFDRWLVVAKVFHYRRNNHVRSGVS